MNTKMILAAAGAVVMLAGCTSTKTVYVSQHQHTTAPAPSASAASPAPSASSSANERQFADAIAASIPEIPARVVAGAVMRAYAKVEHAYGAASAAVGQPAPSSAVSQIAGGFKFCWSDANGSGCDSLTQFSTNSAGQITGVSVNGQPVAGRIATGPNATSGGLTISNVISYRLTDEQNVVAVAFKLTDTSYKPINTSPSLLASLNGANDDTNQDALPSTLGPGDSLYAVAGFDVPRVSGLFCLVPNDGFGEHLPCTTLSKV